VANTERSDFDTGQDYDSSRDFEQLAGLAADERYLLRLYVTGLTPRSTDAIANLKAICEQHLKGRYDLEVIDIYKSPQSAIGQQIVATPTLIKELPAPLRRIVGDLSNRERVLVGLDLRKG
jgi:circadian clock protein KaiB